MSRSTAAYTAPLDTQCRVSPLNHQPIPSLHIFTDSEDTSHHFALFYWRKYIFALDFTPLVGRNCCLQLPLSPSPRILHSADHCGVQNNGPQPSTSRDYSRDKSEQRRVNISAAISCQESSLSS